MPALSESNKIARQVYKAHLEEISKRRGDIVVIDLDQRKVLDVIKKDEVLPLMQRTALRGHIYLLNINPDRPLVWAR